MAASRICQGVTKSGSPTPREMTSGLRLHDVEKLANPRAGDLADVFGNESCKLNGRSHAPKQLENGISSKEKLTHAPGQNVSWVLLITASLGITRYRRDRPGIDKG